MPQLLSGDTYFDLELWNRAWGDGTTDMRCRMTASLRATATLALRNPFRLASLMPQAFSADHFGTRVSNTPAARNTDIGALINSGSAGQPLFEVADLHRVRIYVQVPQAFTADLRPGLKATFEMPQYPGQKFDATLVTTSNAVDEMSRSMLVELQADNPGGKLSGGAYCRVDFQIPGDPNMVRMPATALMPVNRGVQVAVVGDGNKVVLKSIQLGRDFGDTVEVKAGLSPQDRVIDSPPETLQTGDTVQIAVPTPS